MANVKPFSALMYNFSKSGKPEELCCPPYDIIPDTSVWKNKNPYNVISLEKPEGATPYADAKETLKRWLAEDILCYDEAPAFYLYEESYVFNNQRQSISGIMSRVELTDYSEGVIKPHENTLSGAKVDRYELMMATHCHFSPVYALYNDAQHEVLAITGRYKATEPRIEFLMPDGIVHRLWSISSPRDCAAIEAVFASKALYIADGHHRYETSLKVSKELGEQVSPYIMMLLVDMSHPGLLVLPTHRIVHDIPDFDAEALLKKLENDFSIEKSDTLAFNAVVMHVNDVSYRLTLKDESFNGLDVSILHDYILQPHLGIDAANMAAGKNLSYTRDVKDAVDAVNNGTAQCAFILNPTRVEQIKQVSDAGEKMPQKSTYFYPKLITGLVMNDFSKL